MSLDCSGFRQYGSHAFQRGCCHHRQPALWYADLDRWALDPTGFASCHRRRRQDPTATVQSVGRHRHRHRHHRRRHHRRRQGRCDRYPIPPTATAPPITGATTAPASAEANAGTEATIAVTGAAAATGCRQISVWRPWSFASARRVGGCATLLHRQRVHQVIIGGLHRRRSAFCSYHLRRRSIARHRRRSIRRQGALVATVLDVVEPAAEPERIGALAISSHNCRHHHRHC